MEFMNFLFLSSVAGFFVTGGKVKVHILNKDVDNNEIKGGSFHTSFKIHNPSL